MDEFIKSLSEMNMEQVEERLTQLEIEVRSATDIKTVEEKTEQRKALLVRKGELSDLETRKKAALEMTMGKIEGKTIEERGNDKNMEKFSIDSKEYRSAFLRNLQGKELTVEERSAIGASAVIPTMTMNKIVEKLEQTSALYEYITVSNIPSNVDIPVETAVADASWIEMNTASTDSADNYNDKISLTAHKLIKTVEIGADVSNMSIDAFEDFLVNKLNKKMHKAIENAILNGTGTNQPTGILKANEVTKNLTYTRAGMKYKDLMAIIAALPTDYAGTFIMPRTTFFGEVLGMEDSTGNKVVVADAQAPAKFNVLGYPVIVDDYMPADTVLFGDLSYYYLNWSKDIEISADASVGFRTGSTVYRALALLDGKLTSKDAFVKATKATA